jgi:hypothetical protein
MTEKQEQEVAQALARMAEPKLPPHQITIAVDAKESVHYKCGDQRVRGAFRGHKLTNEMVVAFSQRCYDLKAGAKTKLTIGFLENNEKTTPKGTLVLEPTRGKVSPSRIELDGKKSEVTVEYTAPDETIRVSIRAFLVGFARGKVHLHLEA